MSVADGPAQGKGSIFPCENKPAREVLALHEVILTLHRGKDDSAYVPVFLGSLALTSGKQVLGQKGAKPEGGVGHSIGILHISQ